MKGFSNLYNASASLGVRERLRNRVAAHALLAVGPLILSRRVPWGWTRPPSRSSFPTKKELVMFVFLDVVKCTRVWL